MKTTLFLVCTLLISLNALSQATWNRVYENPLVDFGFGYDVPSGMFLTEDHILVFCESAYCSDCEGSSYRLKFYKIDYMGNVVDTVRYPEETDEFYWINSQWLFYGMFQNSLNEIVFMAYHYPDNSQLDSYHNTLLHVDSDLNVLSNDTLWQFSNESNRYDYIENSTQGPDSNYLVAGHSLPITGGDLDDYYAILAKIDPQTGDSIWFKEYPDLFAIHKLHVEDENIIWAIAGKRIHIPEFDYQYVLLKMDNEGSILKSAEFGGEGGEGQYRSVHILLEDDRIAIGGFLSNDDPDDVEGVGTYSTLIFEESENSLNLAQTKRYGYNHSAVGAHGFFKAETDTSNNYMLYGSYLQYEDPIQRGLLLHLDENLDSLWSRQYYYYENYQSTHHLRYFRKAPDGGFIGCGYIQNAIQDPFPTLSQLWIFKTDEYGCIEPGCQDVNVDEIIVGLEDVMSVYPNPARGQVTIEFDFPAGYSPPNKGEFRLMSTDGKEVLRKKVNASSFSSSLQLDISSLKAEVYILHWMDGKKWMDSVRIVIN